MTRNGTTLSGTDSGEKRRIDLSPLRRIRENEQEQIEILDQTLLPYSEHWLRLNSLDDVIRAITDMQVRGAPLIGIIAAYGIALGLWSDPGNRNMSAVAAKIFSTRPTAHNLSWALQRICERLRLLTPSERLEAAWKEADAIAAEDAAQNLEIGRHGLKLLHQLAEAKTGNDRTLQLLTHCNAGWLATAKHGTALAPIYLAKEENLRLHVWVSETRPRNQGLLTAWELFKSGVSQTIIADNAAGHLLLQKRVDAVIVGADRVAANGDVVNKIGTSMKAIVAKHCNIPVYVAAPGNTFDFSVASGADIPLEIRNGDEVRFVSGLNNSGKYGMLRQIADFAATYNPAFDVTPAEFITAIITERGVCAPTANALARLFPEKANQHA